MPSRATGPSASAKQPFGPPPPCPAFSLLRIGRPASHRRYRGSKCARRPARCLAVRPLPSPYETGRPARQNRNKVPMRDTTPAFEKRLARIHLGQEGDSTWNSPPQQRVIFGHPRVARARPCRRSGTRTRGGRHPTISTGNRCATVPLSNEILSLQVSTHTVAEKTSPAWVWTEVLPARSPGEGATRCQTQAVSALGLVRLVLSGTANGTQGGRDGLRTPGGGPRTAPTGGC